MTTRWSGDQIPSWARAILFWRKVLAVERRGIPGSRRPGGSRDESAGLTAASASSATAAAG